MSERTVKEFTRSEFLSLLDSKESKQPPESFGKLPESYQKMDGVDHNELIEQIKQGPEIQTVEPIPASQELDDSSLGDFKNDEGIMKLADNLASVLLAELKGKDSYLPVSFIENAYKKMYGTNLAEECKQNGFSSTVQFLGAHPKYFKNRGNQWSAIVGEAEKYNVADMLGSNTGTEKRYQRNINWHQNPNKTHIGFFGNTSMNRPPPNMNATMFGWNQHPMFHGNFPFLFPSSPMPAFRPTQFRPLSNGESSFDPFVYPNEQKETYQSSLRRSRSQEIVNYRYTFPNRNNDSRGLDEERFHSENGKHFENKPPQLRSVTPVEHRPPVPYSPEPAKVTDSKAGIDKTKNTAKNGKIEDGKMAMMLFDIIRHEKYEMEASMAVTMLEARTKKFELAPNGDLEYLKKLREKVPTLLEVLRFKQKKVNGVLVDYVFIDIGKEKSDEDNRNDAYEEPELLTSIQPSLSHAQRRTCTTRKLQVSNNGKLIIENDDAVKYLLSKKPNSQSTSFLKSHRH